MIQSAALTQAAAIAELLARMRNRTIEQEQEQTLLLCSIVRILADACSGECSAFIDLASDIEAQVEKDREALAEDAA